MLGSPVIFRPLNSFLFLFRRTVHHNFIGQTKKVCRKTLHRLLITFSYYYQSNENVKLQDNKLKPKLKNHNSIIYSQYEKILQAGVLPKLGKNFQGVILNRVYILGFFFVLNRVRVSIPQGLNYTNIGPVATPFPTLGRKLKNPNYHGRLQLLYLCRSYL